MSHSVLTLIALFVVLYPFHVSANAKTSTPLSFKDKVKAMFISEKVDDQQVIASSQTMPLFKPVVNEDATIDTADTASGTNNQEVMQAVSGSLRVSTEDIDFPMTDTVSVYEVKQGDTIQDVAKLFNVSVNTIMWANTLNSKTINQGQTLVILPITGIKHTVKKGDTLTSLAKKYKADEQDIASYNGLAIDAPLIPNVTILIPDGEIEVIAPKAKAPKNKKSKILNIYSYVAPSDFLIRPLVGGRKTQGIHGHNGIDIAATPGTPVLASGSGRVIVAKMGGYNGGYGNMIIISHDKGIQTVYAHLRDISISQGQSVTQGQMIGEVGNSGHSTGPHLHFEVRGAKNPF